MKISLLVSSLILCTAAFAQNETVVRWRGIEGVITAPGVDNPVGQIHSGAGPWTARSGSATINLTTGQGSFDVEGLVLNGGSATGTPGAVTAVVGTLVCNSAASADTAATIIDTPQASLNSSGNAELSFRINVPAACGNPTFLIRVPAGRWIATGTKPSSASNSRY